jgi:hypothetical protein
MVSTQGPGLLGRGSNLLLGMVSLTGQSLLCVTGVSGLAISSGIVLIDREDRVEEVAHNSIPMLSALSVAIMDTTHGIANFRETASC